MFNNIKNRINEFGLSIDSLCIQSKDDFNVIITSEKDMSKITEIFRGIL